MKTLTQQNSDRVPLEDLIPLPAPIGLCIEPANICNFKCKCCPVSLPEYYETVPKTGCMDISLYRKIIHEIDETGIELKKLNLYGDGEPLLHKDLGYMIRLGKTVASTVCVTTNASLLTKKRAQELVDSKLDYLRVSIYGTRSTQHYQLTRYKKSPEFIWENVAALQEIRDEAGTDRPFIYVKMLDSGNTDETERFRERYAGIADQVNLESPMNWNGTHDFIGAVDPNRVTDETLIQGFYEEAGQPGQKNICTTCFSSLNIKSNGDVCVCIVDWNRSTKVGNIANQSLMDIWNGEELRNFRRMMIEGRRHENPGCANCKYMYNSPDSIDHIPTEKLLDIYK